KDIGIKSYDDTTLFCSAGMQQFKDKFKDKNYKGTFANVQSCLRLNDFNEIGDGKHLLYFKMLGLFSFREMSIKDAIDFWMGFMKSLGITLTHTTIHPDKKDWVKLYENYSNYTLSDKECKWSDGKIGGYSTEFHFGDIEIGNIVNPLGDCIDCGFGLERLERVRGKKYKSKINILKETANKIIEAGFEPSNTKQGYVLRKILREIYKEGGKLNHPLFKAEAKRQKEMVDKYNKLKKKFKNKSPEWWYETHGIDKEIIK
ncbi:MAG: alanine--tRNA ligase-related protein, partial [Atribacterota bacterium]|nr:alanine--tRNA ligase-related protein [Atribacterota bacterium]